MSAFKEYLESTSINLGAIANFEVDNKVNDVVQSFKTIEDFNSKIEDQNIFKQIGKLCYSLEFYLTKIKTSLDAPFGSNETKHNITLFLHVNIVKLIKDIKLSKDILSNDLRAHNFTIISFKKKLEQGGEILADSLSKILNQKVKYYLMQDKKKKDPEIYFRFKIEL